MREGGQWGALLLLESGEHIWIICAEAENNVAVRPHHKCVSPHRNFWEGIIVGIEAGFFFRPNNCLEGVPMQMERMLSRILIVEDDLDNLILL